MIMRNKSKGIMAQGSRIGVSLVLKISEKIFCFVSGKFLLN